MDLPAEVPAGEDLPRRRLPASRKLTSNRTRPAGAHTAAAPGGYAQAFFPFPPRFPGTRVPKFGAAP